MLIFTILILSLSSSSFADNGWIGDGGDPVIAWWHYYSDFRNDAEIVLPVKINAGECSRRCSKETTFTCTHYTYDYNAGVCYMIKPKDRSTIKPAPRFGFNCGFLTGTLGM